MIYPQRQILITTAPSPSSTPADFFLPNKGNLQPISPGTLKAGNLEGLPPPRPPTAMGATTMLFSARCRIKGCVFPASDPATGMCHSHGRQEIEPEFFQSYQPILYVLQQGKYGIPDRSFDNAHFHKRRLLFRHRKAAKKGAA